MEPKTTEERVDAAVARLLAGVAGTGNQNVTIKLEGGGRLGLSVICAVVCVVCCLGLGGVVGYLAYKVENQSMQLNAIYMMAPHLKPEN